MTTLAERIRRIREFRGYKQTWMAQQMEITQQAYSSFEQTSDNAKLGTLRRFCDVCEVSLAFLLSEIPISDEHVQAYACIDIFQIALNLKKEQTKVEILEDLFAKNMKQPIGQ